MKLAICGDVHLSSSFRCRTDDFLQTALGKLAYMADNNDKVIILGDLFHLYSNSTLFFNTVYSFFSNPKYEGKFMSILGNHDLFHHSLNSINKTTIGSLELTGVLKILRESFTIDNITFDVSPCIKDLSKLGDSDNCKVLLGHNYVEMNDCPAESFTKEEIKELNYNMIFLGHDHSPYPEERVGNTTLVRMGSLTRIDTQQYNKDRKIYYYQLDTKTWEYIKLEVPSRPVNECYLEGAFNKSSESKKSNYAGLGALLSRFDKRVNAGKMEMPKVIRDLGGKEEHITYLREIHRDNNVKFD